MNISTMINHNPLVIKNLVSCTFDFFVPYKNADVPAKNTKIGAQEWVMNRVKNKTGLVVSIFTGS
jgi:hypothetical protein